MLFNKIPHKIEPPFNNYYYLCYEDLQTIKKKGDDYD